MSARRSQRLPLAVLPVLRLPRALVVARAHRAPRCEVSRRGEDASCRGRSRPACSRRCAARRRGSCPDDRGLASKGRLFSAMRSSSSAIWAFEEAQLLEQGLEQEAVVLGHPPARALRAAPGSWCANAAGRAPPEVSGVVLPCDHRLEHLPARDAQDVAGHRAQLDVGVLQRLVDAVGDRASVRRRAWRDGGSGRAARGCGRPARSCRATSRAAATARSTAQSLTSVLRPGTCLMCSRVDQQHSKRPSRMFHTGFQNTPVDFHRDVRHRRLGQPRRQRQQLPGGRTEGPHLLVELAVGPDDATTDDDRLAVDVQTCAAPEKRDP